VLARVLTFLPLLTPRVGGVALRVLDAVPAAPMVTRLDPLPLVGDGVLFPFGIWRQVFAPPNGVAPSAVAASPRFGGGAEVTVGQRAAGVGRLRGSKRGVGAWLLEARHQVDLGRGTIMPRHRLMAARVVVGMPMAHDGCSGLTERRRGGGRVMSKVLYVNEICGAE